MRNAGGMGSADDAGWSMRCPACAQPLGALPPVPACDVEASGAIRCGGCGAVWAQRDGIWRFLTADDAARLAPFVDEYTAVRRAEGRAAMTAAQRLALPYALPSTPLAWQWRIRAASYRALCRFGLPEGGGRLVDVGAGTGWLSWRLAVGGRSVLAVDVSDDAGDGLAAAQVYADDLCRRGLGHRLARALASADRLPVADGAADVVVFNASLHYTPDPAVTLAEAARAVRPGGRVVVVDSPIYGRRSSGEAMVAERAAAFEARYGFPSTAQGSREFLVAGELDALGAAFGLAFRHVRPFVDVGWSLRPLVARMRGRRAPSRFAVSVGAKAGAPGGDDRGREGGRSRMV